MKKIISLIAFLSLLLLYSCNVHQWPEVSDNVKLHLRLDYDTELTEWNHKITDEEIIDQGLGEVYDNALKGGVIRYIVRAYPYAGKIKSSHSYIKEFEFTRNIADGYNCEYILDLPEGEYSIMVWSDLLPAEDATPYYITDDFAAIINQEEYSGNTNYRDAFRGYGTVDLNADIYDRAPEQLSIKMQRPLAKYEFVTTDLDEFIEKEIARLEGLKKAKPYNNDENLVDNTTRTINIEDYKVVFYYSGYMHNTYSMYDDKPVNSALNVRFEAKLQKLSDKAASIGFDYVFVNGVKSTASVKIGIYDQEGTQLSLTETIKVPVLRNYHTILTGSFLMSDSSGGMYIDPEFEGDHNVNI